MANIERLLIKRSIEVKLTIQIWIIIKKCNELKENIINLLIIKN